MHPLLLLLASLAPAFAHPQNAGGGGFLTLPTPAASSSSGAAAAAADAAAATTPTGFAIPGTGGGGGTGGNTKRDVQDDIQQALSILQGLASLDPGALQPRSPQTANAPEITGGIILRAAQGGSSDAADGDDAGNASGSGSDAGKVRARADAAGTTPAPAADAP
ncbi:hypothetical protein KEM52_002680, partial [Ascosphaera acerosa]